MLSDINIDALPIAEVIERLDILLDRWKVSIDDCLTELAVEFDVDTFNQLAVEMRGHTTYTQLITSALDDFSQGTLGNRTTAADTLRSLLHDIPMDMAD
jgi:D-ribose pyranose/furanose isomerase RbsD